MTDVRPVLAALPVIAKLWTTPVKLARLKMPSQAMSPFDKGENSEQWADALRLRLDEMVEGPGEFSMRTERWHRGHTLAVLPSRALWHGVVVIQADPVCGSGDRILVCDPRPGAFDALPGCSVFGRPLSVPLGAGLLLAVPGWIEWWLMPVRIGGYDVVRFERYEANNDTRL